MARIHRLAAFSLVALLTMPAAHAAKVKRPVKAAPRTTQSSAKAAKVNPASSKKITVVAKKGKGITIVPAPKKLHGQQAIESARVQQIQEALIRERYLTGEPNGQWNAETITAMQKFQADQGWQTKLMPDSRALKKLGLGPDYSTAINAQNGNFVPPPPPSTIPADVNTGFTDASGVKTN